MEFNKDTLTKIIAMGANGKSPFSISLELNMTPDELEDHRKKNKDLNNAMERAEKNYSLYRIDQIEKNPNSSTQREVYLRHLNQHGSNDDNEIIITRK